MLSYKVSRSDPLEVTMMHFFGSDSFLNTSLRCLSLEENPALLLQRMSSQKGKEMDWNMEKNRLRSYRLPLVSWGSFGLGR